MCELKKKLEIYLRVNLLGPGPRLIKKSIYWAAVSQILRNTAIDYGQNIKKDYWYIQSPRGGVVVKAYATNRQVAVSIPDDVIGIFQ